MCEISKHKNTLKTKSKLYSDVDLCVCPQLSEMLLSALNQNLVQFTLRPGVQVTVYAAHHSAGKLEILNRSINGNNAHIDLNLIKNGMDGSSRLIMYAIKKALMD